MYDIYYQIYNYIFMYIYKSYIKITKVWINLNTGGINMAWVIINKHFFKMFFSYVDIFTS